MLSVFFELVKRVGIFMIIGQTILHFGISKEYEKYMKMVISFMVAAQIIFSFGAYFCQDSFYTLILDTKEYYETWDKNRKEIEEALWQHQEELKDKIEMRVENEKKEVKEIPKETENIVNIEKIIIQ